VVEPVHPLKRGELHVLEALPVAALSDESALEKPVDGLVRGIIIGIPAGPHGGDSAGLLPFRYLTGEASCIALRNNIG
jgi:hypothetical protein